MPKRARPAPDPTGRRRAPASSSFPRGAALREIADRHPLTQADVNHIIAHVDGWRRTILGEPGPAPTGPIGRASS